MSKLYNLARMTTATTGTGTITLGSAVSGFLTFALAGVANGDVVSYGIFDGANSEVGTGTYTASGTTLTRTVTKSTNGNAAISLSGAAEVYVTARADDLLSISETQTANKVLAGPASGGATAPAFRSLVQADMPFDPAPITNSLSADVALNNTANFFAGPSVAQGTTGTWFVSGIVTVVDTSAAAGVIVKLWDGTTVIASTEISSTGANFTMALSLSGFIASPAGNLRMDVKDASSANGKLLFNLSGLSKDCTITAFRIK